MISENKWEKEHAFMASILDKTDLEKSIKWGAPVYTLKGNNVVSYLGFKNFFSVWFYNGVFLKDPYKVLVNAQEGKTKSMRQWRFTSVSEMDERKIMDYIQEAVEIEIEGLKIKPDKFKPAAIPNIFSEIFSKDVELQKSFQKLTPGKQKEYILHIEEAKQEATKLKRLEKVIPMIMEGKGLNDKYK
ncbi:MAG: YdeI/OmpD-associated family protein [Saprospiraceae bacterium]|nr:YdeI/OmpD-associated family protein [Saprospiraceae bacterium]